MGIHVGWKLEICFISAIEKSHHEMTPIDPDEMNKKWNQIKQMFDLNFTQRQFSETRVNYSFFRNEKSYIHEVQN
jgi:hypothetical protein